MSVLGKESGLGPDFRTGEADTLAAVYRTHVHDVVRTARAVLRACVCGTTRGKEVSSELADVVQEVFAKAFAIEARQRFDCKRDLRPYLLQIARNVAIDHWRERRRHILIDPDRIPGHLPRHAQTDAHLDESWAGAGVAAAVQRFIASLGGVELGVHDALYVRGLSQRQAAAALGVGRQVIRTVQAKLRADLEMALADAGCLEHRRLRSRAGRQTDK